MERLIRSGIKVGAVFCGVLLSGITGLGCVEESVTGRVTQAGFGLQPVYVVSGRRAGDQLGTGVAAVGDLDGDGISEFAAGSPSAMRDPDGCAEERLTRRGVVRLYNGASGDPFKDGDRKRAHCGSEARELFGRTIKGIGDTDGDGISDYAIASPAAASDGTAGTACPPGGEPATGLPGRGVVRVYSGKSGELLTHLVFCGYAAYESLGSVIVAPGDLDGDGSADLVLGSPTASVHPNACPDRPTDPDLCPEPKEGEPDQPCSRGYVEGRSGKDGSILFASCGSAAGDSYGTWVGRTDSPSIFGFNDLDGDGKADFSVARDKDGDGKTDLAVGAPGSVTACEGTGATGATYLLLSTKSWAMDPVDVLCRNRVAEGGFSLDLTPGDLDSNGVNDIPFGNPSHPGALEGFCPTVAVLGGIAAVDLYEPAVPEGDVNENTPFAKIVDAAIICGGQGEALGSSYDLLPVVGDSDGDGVDDPDWIIIGVPGADPEGSDGLPLTNAGSVIVYQYAPQ